MSTATKTQTQQEREQVIEAWDRTKGALAETARNLQIMQQALTGYMQKYGDFISVDILNAIVRANAHQLDFLATPAAPKPTPAKPTGNRLWNKLVDVGVAPTRHSSVAEQQAENKKVEDKQNQFLKRAHLLNEQAKLLEEKSQAEYGNLVMHRLGIDHYRTGEKRKAAKAKLLPKLTEFNSRCVNSGNNNLVIPV